MANQGTIALGPWGGIKGYSENFMQPNTSITEIHIGYKDVIDSLQFKSIDQSNNSTNSGKWGAGTAIAKIDIKVPAQYLTSIKGTTTTTKNGNVVIESLSFRIGKTWSESYGPTTGTPFEIPMENGEIVGFFGRAGDLIDAIGIYAIPHAAP